MQLTSPSRRTFGLLAAGTLAMSTAVLATAGPAAAELSGWTFSSVDHGSVVVPAGTCGVRWTLVGAAGGAGAEGAPAGPAEEVRVTTTVYEDQVLTLLPGTAGAAFADGSAGGTVPAYDGAFDGLAGNDATDGGGGGAASVVLEGEGVYLWADGGAGGGADGGTAGSVDGPANDSIVPDPDRDLAEPPHGGPDGLITGTGIACEADDGSGEGSGGGGGEDGGYENAPPLAPLDVTARAGDGELLVSYAENYADAVDPADRWEVKLDAADWAPVDAGYGDAGGLEFTLDGLTNGRTYAVRVRGVSELSGAGAASAPVTGTPYEPLAAPTAVDVSTAPSALKISWDAPGAGGTFDLDGYKVVIAWSAGEYGGIYEPCDTDAATRECYAGVPAGEKYVVFVMGIDSEGNQGVNTDGIPTDVVPFPAVPESVPTADAPLEGVSDGAALTSGETVTIRGKGFLPNSTVQAVVYSTPTPLGSFSADAAGAFEVEVTIPDGLHAGEHSLVVSGLDPSGAPRYLRVDVTVSGEEDVLAYTGATVVGPAIGGLVAVVAGAGLLVAARRRTATV